MSFFVFFCYIFLVYIIQSSKIQEIIYALYRGYSNFLLNMAFISSSEVENIYIS